MPSPVAHQNEDHTTLTTVYDAHVTAGAAHLDERRLSCTTRWRNYIDWSRLDMGDIRRDLLRQLGTSLDALGLTLDQAIAYGFEPIEDDDLHADMLTAAWLRWHANETTKAVA